MFITSITQIEGLSSFRERIYPRPKYVREGGTNRNGEGIKRRFKKSPREGGEKSSRIVYMHTDQSCLR